MTQAMKIPLGSYEDLLFVQERHLLQHVGKISAAFLWPTRHRVVSAFYCTPNNYNWKQAEGTTAQGIVYDFEGSEA